MLDRGMGKGMTLSGGKLAIVDEMEKYWSLTP